MYSNSDLYPGPEKYILKGDDKLKSGGKIPRRTK